MKYLILGAGPAGLSFANRILQLGEKSFLVLEKEKKAGGLCRSEIVDGAPFDIGGGHFLDVRRPQVNDFLFEFLAEDEWNVFERNSQIVVNNTVINSPIEANIWQMNLDTQVDYLKSIAVAGCNIGQKLPDKFIDWIYWKLGKRIAEDYMIPYNKKMFGNELNQLGTYWLDKLPNVSFEETLLSCLEKKAYGKQPGHASFLYPKKYGYGEVWLRMAQKLDGHIAYNKSICNINFNEKSVTTKDGTKYKADVIITTIPWLELDELIGMPNDLVKDISDLKYSSIQTEYFDERLNTKAHWIYYPNPELSYHRILVRHNFCENSKGYWTETNIDRVNGETERISFMSKYAYPLNTLRKPEIMTRLLEWSKKRNIIGLGRWGEHQHYNSDVTVERALNLAEKIMKR